MKIQRKARTTKHTMKMDLTKPVDISKIATSGDCFGVLWDLKASECKICGDNELCSIVYQQNAHIKRKEIEKNQKFKDIESQELNKPENLNSFLVKLFDKSKSQKLSLITISKSLKADYYYYKNFEIKAIAKDLRVQLKVSALFKFISITKNDIKKTYLKRL